MQIKIAPSILSADFSRMGEAVKLCEESGADLVHCDVMDGSFVGPITFGGQMVKNIRPVTKLPLDVHLMIEHPKTQIKFFADAGADIITVHYEACAKISENYLRETLELIKSYGVKCGAVISPDTPFAAAESVLELCDIFLVMSVYPGLGGQKFIERTLPKAEQAKNFILSHGLSCLVEIDGGVTEENAARIVGAGVDVLVAGNTVFRSADMAKTIAALRGGV